MNRLFDRLFSFYASGLLLAVACLVPLVRAQDAPPPCPPPIEKTGDVLILRHCTGDDPTACTGQTYVFRGLQFQPGELFNGHAPQAVEQLSKTFHLFVAPAEHTLQAGPKFIRLGCACAAGVCACAPGKCDCAKTGECKCASQQTCVGECAAATHTGNAICPCTGTDETKCGDENCHAEQTIVQHHIRHLEEIAEHHPLKLMQHIAHLASAKAAAEAALEVRKEADEQIGEIYEALSELYADNAALDAKLKAQTEHHAEQRKLLEKVAELATENARLKTHIELAAERAELARTSTALAFENERLKLRLADIEHQLVAPTATASKPRERKAR